jgi:UDP-N-acetylmuramate--alanine ligase
LRPTIAVVTNAELDHHTTYASSKDVDDTFAAFLALAEHAVVPPELLRLAPGAAVFEPMGLSLSVPGEHNQRNAAAALTAIRLTGEDVGTFNGARIVDDYAHHPTEVRATIEAARTQQPRRVIALFQPHLYSRTQREARAFGAALARADLPVVLDVYPARERAEDYPGVTGLLVAQAAADAGAGKRVAWVRDHATADAFLRRELQPGDLLLTMGAGDVDRVGQGLAGAGRSSGP